MTESGTDSATSLWSVPECPFQIETSARVLDDIRLAVVDAFFSLPRGGAEIGGILLGAYQDGKLAITDYAALECEHAFGPSFTLSPPDEARLQALLSRHANNPLGPRPVGWYHSHTRSEIFLSDADLAIHERYFPKPWQVALVMKPHTFQPARIGFFFQDANGSMRADASYQEIPLEALPIGQVPNGVPTAAPRDETPLRRYRPAAPPPEEELAAAVAPKPDPKPDLKPDRKPEPAPAPAPQAVNAPLPPAIPVPVPDSAVEVPPPQFLSQAPPASRRWIWVLVAVGVILGAAGAGFQTRQAWLPRVRAAGKPVPPPEPPPPPSLGLNTIDRDGQLQVNWDRNSRALLNAADALLEITDGGPLPQDVQLDRAHLETGSFTYARQSEKVDVKLIVHQVTGPDFREVTSFLGKLPERQPAEDPEVQKQRDELAKQAAKLKTDLNWQAAKTKKLEKDLKSMREEMKQQQMKRLTNQVPDK